MRNLKKLASLLLALVMVLSLTVTAFAAETTGSITLNDADNVSVAGKTFKAYQILELKLVDGTEATGHVYTVPDELKVFYSTKFGISTDDVDFDYKVTQKIAEMQSNSDQLFAFAKEALAKAKEVGITPKTATGAEGATSVTINDLPLGYYVIEDEGTATPISALILDSTNPDINVQIKADKPSLDKNIDGDKDSDTTNSGKVEYNNTSIGDTVPYVLDSKVPDMTGYTKYFFVITDTLSKGLTFQNDVAITIGDKTLVKDTDFTVETADKGEDGTEVTIVLKNFIQYKDKAGAAITVTYSAIVNKDAVIGVDGNPNEAKLIYSNNPNITPDSDDDKPDPTDDDVVGETPKEETYTYVTEVELLKTDDGGNVLTGAEFQFEGTRRNTVIVIKETFVEDAAGTYYSLKDGTYTTEVPNKDTIGKYNDIGKKYILKKSEDVKTKEENVTLTATVGEDGKLIFSGLAAGEYTITEIKAPDGYNRLDKPIKLTIGWTAPETNSTKCTWTYTWTSENEEGSTSAGTNSYQLTVVNKTGVELPSTGGMGTTLFYIAGGILVLAAVVLLVTKKRMQNAE